MKNALGCFEIETLMHFSQRSSVKNPKRLYLSKEAEKSFTTEEFEDVAYFEPFYLKDFIAGKESAIIISI